MIKDELVTTRVRPTDGRVTEVCLTDKGDQLRKLALVEAHAIYDQAFAGIDPARVREMNKLMSEVHAAMKKLDGSGARGAQCPLRRMFPRTGRAQPERGLPE
jgi:hypothetical protein